MSNTSELFYIHKKICINIQWSTDKIASDYFNEGKCMPVLKACGKDTKDLLTVLLNLNIEHGMRSAIHHMNLVKSGHITVPSRCVNTQHQTGSQNCQFTVFRTDFVSISFWLCLTSHRQRGHFEMASHLLSLVKEAKLGFYTVPTGNRTPGHNMAIHYTIAAQHHPYLFSSLLVICHFHIYMTDAGAMHEAGYIYSIWSS